MNPLLAGTLRAAGTAKKVAKKVGSKPVRGMAALARAAGANNVPALKAITDKMSKVGLSDTKKKKPKGDVEKATQGGDGGKQENPNSEVIKQNDQHHEEDKGERATDRIERRAKEAQESTIQVKSDQVQEEMLRNLESINDKIGVLEANAESGGKKEEGSGGSLLGTLASAAGMMGMAGMLGGKGKIGKALKFLNPFNWGKKSKAAAAAKNLTNFRTVNNSTKMITNAPFAQTVNAAAKSGGKSGAVKGGAKALAAGAGMATAAKAAGKVGVSAGKTVMKSAIKKIPILGALAGIGFGIGRLMDGDFTGAALEVASGAASIFPGAGTAASVGIDAALLARDVKNAKDSDLEQQLADTTEIEPVTQNFSRYFEQKAIEGDDNSNRNKSSIANNSNTTINKEHQALYDHYNQNIRKDVNNVNESQDSSSVVSNRDSITSTSGLMRSNIYKTDAHLLSKDIPPEYIAANAAIKEYQKIERESKNQQPIIIQQPSSEAVTKEIKVGGGSSGAIAPLITSTLDSTIRSLHLNTLKKGMA